MESARFEQRLIDFDRLCRERGIARTAQRRRILEAVLGLEGHPTADDVHRAVTKVLPGLSRTTVYRTLETLVGLGLITKACHPGASVRFDPRVETHHHLVCLSCNALNDHEQPELDALEVSDTHGLGFVVEDYRVQIRGTCRRCLERRAVH